MLYNISNSLWININTIIIFLILNIILWLEIFVNIIQGDIFYILSATYLKEIVEKENNKTTNNQYNNNYLLI